MTLQNFFSKNLKPLVIMVIGVFSLEFSLPATSWGMIEPEQMDLETNHRKIQKTKTSSYFAEILSPEIWQMILNEVGSLNQWKRLILIDFDFFKQFRGNVIVGEKTFVLSLGGITLDIVS